MYSNELTPQKELEVAQAFVLWLYFYHRKPVNGREVDDASIQEKCSRILLDYTPSIHRDNRVCRFYTSSCLTCGYTHYGAEHRVPYSESCYRCIEVAVTDVQLEWSTLNSCVLTATTDIDLHYTPYNPMACTFEVLPVAVQQRVAEILLDPATHSKYNGSNERASHVQQLR